MSGPTGYCKGWSTGEDLNISGLVNGKICQLQVLPFMLHCLSLTNEHEKAQYSEQLQNITSPELSQTNDLYIWMCLMSKLMIKLSLTLKLNVQSACQLVSPHSGVQMLDGVSANLRLDTTVHWFLHHPLHHTSLSLDYRDLSSYFQRHLQTLHVRTGHLSWGEEGATCHNFHLQDEWFVTLLYVGLLDHGKALDCSCATDYKAIITKPPRFYEAN